MAKKFVTISTMKMAVNDNFANSYTYVPLARGTTPVIHVKETLPITPRS
jgi:hypothetical protein